MEYQRRLSDFQRDVEQCSRLDGRLSTARGITFISGLTVLGIALISEDLSALLVLPFVAVFVGLVLMHGRVLRRLDRARRAAAYYTAAIARLEGRWMGVGTTGGRYLDVEHPFASDLDLFGGGSLFQLLCRARTRLGEDALADWLLNPSSVETIRSRHGAIGELRQKLELREKLALLDAEVHDLLDQNRLRRWCEKPAEPISPGLRLLAGVTATASIVAIGGLLIRYWGLSVPLMVLLIQWAILFSIGRRIRALAVTADEAASGLEILSQVLAVLESEKFQDRSLCELHDRLRTEGRPPSWHVARLQQLIGYLDNCLKNQFFAPLGFLLCLPVHLVHAIECWRGGIGPSVVVWLSSVGELEALLSLANHAWEHPDDKLPELIDGDACFEGTGLAHPLLPEKEAVRNDLSLSKSTRVAIISGSNMSGKSTMLRTVGTNTILALAGAPVRAEKLRLTPLRLGTVMRVIDSLQDHRSLFYTSLRRLQTVVKLAGDSPPLLFLLDELLQGTNSHDRCLGAEAVLQTLVQRDAIGLVTTHDLAMTKLADSLGAPAVNLHFEDHVENGQMTFDYRIRAGIVQRSNAIELMRMMGIDVSQR